MAKARRKARTTAAKRPAKKAKRSAAKRTTSKKGRKAAKPKAKRAKARKQGAISGAVQTVTDVIRDVGGLRSRLGRGRFEDQ